MQKNILHNGTINRKYTPKEHPFEKISLTVFHSSWNSTTIFTQDIKKEKEINFSVFISVPSLWILKTG